MALPSLSLDVSNVHNVATELSGVGQTSFPPPDVHTEFPDDPASKLISQKHAVAGLF